ncbi:MAG: beta strand repeat-containing protein, partial [Candidatus Dormibacteria bacterium]
NTLSGDNTGDLFTLTASNGGTLAITNGTTLAATFTGMQNLAGNSGSGADTFDLGSGSLSGNITGGGGTNTLIGGNGANSWTVTGTDTGTLTGVGGTFSAIENLTGGTGNDDFVFDNGATVSGVVDGGAGGVNTLDFTAYTTAMAVSLTGSNAFGASGTTSGSPNPIGGSFAEITAIDLPALANTLNLNAVSSTVLINSSAATNLFNLTVEQSGVPNLTFGNVSVVNGGTGVVNTLESAEASTNTWTITGPNSGTYNDSQSLTFSHFADLVGGSGNDNFIFSGGSVASLAGGGGSNTLTGDNAGDLFTINAANGGQLTSGATTLVGAFSGIQNLTGGSGNDTFAFATGGSVSGTVNGGAGTNTLDYSGDTGAVAVNLTNDSASLIQGGTANGFSNIQALTGNGANTTLTGPGGVHTWNITGADQGNLDTNVFTF